MLYNVSIMDTFAAIADPTRRHILEIIADKGRVSATEISNNFHMTPPAISQHLKILREAKLVDMEKSAQKRIYSINPASIEELSHWIEKLKKMWDERFDRLNTVLEKLKRKEEKYGHK